MGYYSEVAFEIREEDFINLLKEIEKPDFSKSYNINSKDMVDFLNSANISENKSINSITVCFSCIKWYPSYSEVAFIEKFVLNLDCYYFIRIGEDYADIEEHWCNNEYEYCFPDSISVVREIAVDESCCKKVNLNDYWGE